MLDFGGKVASIIDQSMNEWVVQVGQGQIQHYFVAHVCKNKHNSSFVPMKVHAHHIH